MKTLASALLITLLAACGSEDESLDTPKGLDTVTNVSGTYSLITSAIAMTCTDGAVDTLPALALTRTVSHTGNEFEFEQEAGEIAGITVIESDTFGGVVEPSGRFVGTSVALVSMQGISGNLTLSYNLAGYFNDDGWSGTYTYSAFFHDYVTTCEYESTFSGYNE